MVSRYQVLAVSTAMLALMVATTWAPSPALAVLTCLNTDSQAEAEYVARVNQDLIDYGQRVASRNHVESGGEDYTQQYSASLAAATAVLTFMADQLLPPPP